MKFTVIPRESTLPSYLSSQVVLHVDNWDDNFKFSTLYGFYYYTQSGEQINIGSLKIGQLGMGTDQRSPDIPSTFEKLDKRFFSLGSDEDYYLNLNLLGNEIRDEILIALRDIAYDLTLFENVLNEPVTELSLLRFVPSSLVKGQFNRLTKGGARLTDFNFKFACPPQIEASVQPVELDFAVLAESTPPTNIHVLIGTNGVGKTFLLDYFSNLVIEDTPITFEEESIFKRENKRSSDIFSGLVSVSFSAFDNITPLQDKKIRISKIRYQYIGLKEKSSTGFYKPMSPEKLAYQFANSLVEIKSKKIDFRWQKAIKLLETDAKFRAEDIAELITEKGEALKKMAIDLFSQLSSGHKIILLTITRLVETVEEKTLILIDEPEAHLHPPLLSAFIRSLSDLLIDRNGIAIIATHSPVVLQEVPKSCVWILNRYNNILKAERPERETFGENVGSLTRDVFGLEVTASGFHKMLLNMIDQKNSYEEVLNEFKGELGDEAKGIVRSLMIKKIQKQADQ